MKKTYSVSAFFVVILLLLDATPSYSGSGPHIAEVNLLLPPRMTHPVEYRLQGTDGCFRWSCDHRDVLSVAPEYNSSSQCSTSARLMSIASYSGRKETAVYATDSHTGIVIRCKVFIDNFSRIQIFHNSIKLDLDGLATLQVRAFDSEDNVFSSLVGLGFMWHLMSETVGLPHHLVHVPLKDSPLGDCGGMCGDLDIQIKLEDSGVYSDRFVVRGTGIGQEIVFVHLSEPQFEHMNDKIILTVAEAMSLDPPSPVLILIGATLRYSLKVIQNNIPQVITLPSPHYQWSILNSSIAHIDTEMGVVHALNLGITTVGVEDTRIAGHIQMSSLHVVLPDALSLYIFPLSRSGDAVIRLETNKSLAHWHVICGCQYLIQIKVFVQGSDAQEIYVTESDDIRLYNQPEYWEIFMVSGDHAGSLNSRILEATSQGHGVLTASLTYTSGKPEAKEVLKFVQEVIVCDQVKFSLETNYGSQSILLPWAPSVYQEVELKATGGCAKAPMDYRWFSSDMDTVCVSASGVVQAKKLGKATIKVVSIFDPLNYDEVVIEVSVPSSMAMLHNFPVETVVGSHLQAAVTMKASNGAYYYRCDAFNSLVRWKSESESFLIDNVAEDESVLDKRKNIKLHIPFSGPPCAWTYVYASNSGQAMLHATLSKDYHAFNHPSHGGVVLKASSRIAAYLPLIVRQASDKNQFGGYWFNLSGVEAPNQVENLDNLFLAPRAHLDVLLHGGPAQWNNAVDYVETVETLDSEQAQLTNRAVVLPISNVFGTLYRISCRSIGHFKLVFRRGNLVGADHPLLAVAEVELSLTCSFPSSITLLVDEPVNKADEVRTATHADRSLDRSRVTPFTVANGHAIRLAAVGINDFGEPFANSSSLSLNWELIGCDDLAFWGDAIDVVTSKSNWERLLVLKMELGLCTVRANVIGFTEAVKDVHLLKSLVSSKDDLTDAIHLQLVSPLRVTPESILLFFHPDVKANMSIDGGTCLLEAVTNDSQVVEVIRVAPSLQCLNLALIPRGLGHAIITVKDIGLYPPLSVSSVVQVADVDWIKIISPEEISLAEGASLSLNLMAGTSDGSIFDSSQYVYMDVNVHIEDSITDIIDGSHVNMSRLTIVGKHPGIATLYVSASQKTGHKITSQSIKLEVYAPPRIHPDNIFLVPGASYVLTLKGGPRIGVKIEFSSTNNETATLHKSSGRLSAISPGNSTLLARVYGHGDSVLCLAYGGIVVGIPSSVSLTVQSEQLIVGQEMPIFPSLAEGDLFSFYDQCNTYQWAIEDEKVLSFKLLGPLNGNNVGPYGGLKYPKNYSNNDNIGFVNVLYGRSAGSTNVAVSLSCDFISSSYSQSRSYHASLSVIVVPDLPLSLGVPVTWVLPPHYVTSILLPASSDLYGQKNSRSRLGTISYSLLSNCGWNGEVQQDAISIDGGRIRTTESNHVACILAKNFTSGRAEIGSCVRVAEVTQIRITSTKYPFHAVDLAVGAELKLPISYCDVLGNPFHEAHNVISFGAETNYPNIISVSDVCNDNIHLKAISHGRALVRISLPHIPQKSDYMLISVGAHLYPQNPVLYPGSSLLLTVQGLDDQVAGQWSIGNESVLSVDRLSGKTVAVEEGRTQVLFETPSLSLSTTVTVSKGNTLVIDALNETITNIRAPRNGYYFSVKFSGIHDPKIKALENNEAVVHDCWVDPSFVGYTKPWRDLQTGTSFCLFFPYSPQHLVHSMPKMKNGGPNVSISIIASLKEVNHVTGSASALLIGGFSIDKNFLQLDLKPDFNKTIISILGNTDVDINWHERDLIMLSPILREDFGICGHANYEVKVLKAKRFKDRIVISLPATGQRMELDISFDPGESEVSTTATHITRWAAVLGCTGLLIATVAVLLYLGERPERSRPTTRPGTPAATPDRSSLLQQSEHSPRTPQPFVEYVRRTIDETPYYKLERRRRFNPQNTN